MSEAVKGYLLTSKITVNGIKLIKGDLTVQRYLELPPSSNGQFVTSTDNNIIIHLDSNESLFHNLGRRKGSVKWALVSITLGKSNGRIGEL